MAKTRNNYKSIFRKYLEGKLKLKTYQRVGVMFLVVVIAGFVGWTYEVVLNLISHGEFFMKGGNFLPWMNIYAIGAVLVIPATYWIRRQPWAVFLIAALVTGVVELIGGWLAFELFDGARYWDYSQVWWGFGHINGFVCPVSVFAFGIGSMLLMYLLLPFCAFVAEKMSKRAFLILTITLFSVVMVDEIGNLIFKVLDLPTAMDFYRGIGLVYK